MLNMYEMREYTKYSKEIFFKKLVIQGNIPILYSHKLHYVKCYVHVFSLFPFFFSESRLGIHNKEHCL